MNKQHYKLYKSGKLWVTTLVAGATLAMGVITQTTAHADANTVSQPVVTQLTTNNDTNSTAETASSANSNALQANVDNKVPTDTTTTNNDANANEGHLDSYSLSQNENGQTVLHASGWQATGKSNDQQYRYVVVYDNTDHREVSRQKIAPQERTDVQNAYPHIDNSLWSGFNFNMVLPSTDATHSLSIVARYSNNAVSGEGEHTDWWFGPLYIDQGNHAHLDNVAVKDGQITVSGWHASNAAAGKQYHYIIAYDQTQHREIARQEVTAGMSRPDVANSYPTIANAVNSGFQVSFDYSPVYASDDIQYVSRWTNDPAGNGSAVDYWFGAINRDNEGYLDQASLSNGNLVVSGWHANDTSTYANHHYLIVFDNTANQQVASKEVAVSSSSDVAKAYPGIQTAGKSRFHYDFGQLNLLPGHTYSLVSRYSTSANGNGGNGVYVDYWYNMFNLNEAEHSIDGWNATKDNLTVYGWMANDESLTKPYAYAILLDGNGNELQRHQLTLTERPDVANVYPQLYNSGKSGLSVTFDIPADALTNDLQLVLRFTDDPAGNGNSADFWSDKMSTNAGNWDKTQVNSNTIDLSGWHAASSVTDKPYQYIIALDAANGNRELGRWRIDNQSGWQASASRGDVQHVYPWIWNSGNSGFSGTINIGALNNHLVTFLHRYTDDVNGNGNYVDFYSAPTDVHYLNERLQQAWSNIINNSGRRVSIAVQSQQTGQVYTYTNVPGYRFVMASTIKVSVLSQLLHNTGGNLDGTEQALATNMIRNSDNGSTSTLFDYYIGGAGGIGQLYSALGMNESSTNGAWGLTATTAADQLKLLNEIYLTPRTNYLNDQSRNYIRGLMGSINPSQRWGISAGSSNFYVKNGWLPYGGSWHVNSIGFIPGNGNSYTIAVYTDGNGTMQDGINLIQQLAIATKQIMQ